MPPPAAAAPSPAAPGASAAKSKVASVGSSQPLRGERDTVDSASADAAARLRGGVLSSLSCREAEALLDSNFRVNDEVIAMVQQAWDCTVRLDCQLAESDRPEEERNKNLMALGAERMELMKWRAELEVDLLEAKLEVQQAAAGVLKLRASRLADVLEGSMRLRSSASRLSERLEVIVREVRATLRQLGVHPEGVREVTEDRMTRRWRLEFDAARHGNEALLRSLAHPEAALAVPAAALEESIDLNWRLLLEIVGLLEKVVMGLGAPQISEEAPQDAAALQAAAAERESEARELLSEAEEQLKALLECKYIMQECSAAGRDMDLGPPGQRIEAAQTLQAAVWKFIVRRGVDLSAACLTKFAEEMLPHPAAFGAHRTEAYAGPNASDDGLLENGASSGVDRNSSVLRVLSYNLFLRAPLPHFAHNNGDDKKDERLNRFAQHLPRYDLVCLQEVFGAFSHRRDWLMEVAGHLGFDDVHKSSTGVRPRFLVDGGLLILSRLPMVASSSLTFEPGSHLDRLTAKGALYAKLEGAPGGPYLHVCTTHLQSTYSEEAFANASAVRLTQLTQLAEFLRRETAQADEGECCNGKDRRRHWPMLLCGTLNVNGRRGPMDGSSSDEYLALEQYLRSELGEVHNLLLDSRGHHPVTYADTRLTSGGEVPGERVLTAPGVYEGKGSKRQCLDYMFFFPHVPAERSPATNGAGSNGPDLDPVVPATCQVEKFLVDRAKDVGAPVTQLSDHYGIEATLAVVAKRRSASRLCEAVDTDSMVDHTEGSPSSRPDPSAQDIASPPAGAAEASGPEDAPRAREDCSGDAAEPAEARQRPASAKARGDATADGGSESSPKGAASWARISLGVSALSEGEEDDIDFGASGGAADGSGDRPRRRPTSSAGANGEQSQLNFGSPQTAATYSSASAEERIRRAALAAAGYPSASICADASARGITSPCAGDEDNAGEVAGTLSSAAPPDAGAATADELLTTAAYRGVGVIAEESGGCAAEEKI